MLKKKGYCSGYFWNGIYSPQRILFLVKCSRESLSLFNIQRQWLSIDLNLGIQIWSVIRDSLRFLSSLGLRGDRRTPVHLVATYAVFHFGGPLQPVRALFDIYSFFPICIPRSSHMCCLQGPDRRHGGREAVSLRVVRGLLESHFLS